MCKSCDKKRRSARARVVDEAINEDAASDPLISSSSNDDTQPIVPEPSNHITGPYMSVRRFERIYPGGVLLEKPDDFRVRGVLYKSVGECPFCGRIVDFGVGGCPCWRKRAETPMDPSDVERFVETLREYNQAVISSGVPYAFYDDLPYENDIDRLIDKGNRHDGR